MLLHGVRIVVAMFRGSVHVPFAGAWVSPPVCHTGCPPDILHPPTTCTKGMSPLNPEGSLSSRGHGYQARGVDAAKVVVLDGCGL
eukprot:9013622-Heterocapsa_arctica.AAC.1